MQAVSEHLFRRGKRGTLYLRRRIPTLLRDAYPPEKSEVIRSLRTSDLELAKKRLRQENSRLDEEFERRRVKLEKRWKAPKLQSVTHLSEQQLEDLGQRYVHCVLETDEHQRRRGLDDEDFEALGEHIAETRAELGQLLARGQTHRILPAMRSFFRLCGIEAHLSEPAEQEASYRFLQAVITALDHQAKRQAGEVVVTGEVSRPAPANKDWEEVFATWRDYVVDRPKTTTIAYATAWRQLERFAKSYDVMWPAHVTEDLILMVDFVEHLKASLEVDTVNGRLGKIRKVYQIAVGKRLLATNPARDTLGVEEPKSRKGRKKRLPFSQEELQTIFGSPIYTHHLRSKGQSAEASYWIPLIMHYAGARPEEIAGFEVSDIRYAKKLGCWYFHITDLPSNDDEDLFADEAVEIQPDAGDRRRLKNAASRRNVPVAEQLVKLGFLRYLEFIKSQGHAKLFPTLRPDSHGKLSGAHAKFFGRYKRKLGITSRFKTLYSLRHNMKDLLEEALTKVRLPNASRYAQRLLGHTTGDGEVTDGYGSDLPLAAVVKLFSKVRFPAIPAKPWQPGKGTVRLQSTRRATSTPAQRVPAND